MKRKNRVSLCVVFRVYRDEDLARRRDQRLPIVAALQNLSWLDQVTDVTFQGASGNGDADILRELIAKCRHVRALDMDVFQFGTMPPDLAASKSLRHVQISTDGGDLLPLIAQLTTGVTCLDITVGNSGPLPQAFTRRLFSLRLLWGLNAPQRLIPEDAVSPFLPSLQKFAANGRPSEDIVCILQHAPNLRYLEILDTMIGPPGEFQQVDNYTAIIQSALTRGAIRLRALSLSHQFIITAECSSLAILDALRSPLRELSIVINEVIPDERLELLLKGVGEALSRRPCLRRLRTLSVEFNRFLAEALLEHALAVQSLDEVCRAHRIELFVLLEPMQLGAAARRTRIWSAHDRAL